MSYMAAIDVSGAPTIKDIVDALGGSTEVARRFGTTRLAVNMWPRQGIPVEHQQTIAAHIYALSVKLSLADLEAIQRLSIEARADR